MDKANNASINELNSLLKGENMAVDSIEKVIAHVDDDNIKNELQKIQQNHKQHTALLADRIQDLGGTPAKGVGLGGKAAEMMSVVKDIGKTGTASHIKEILDGENKGIQMSAELVKGDLDSDSAKLVNSILDEDRNNVNMLQGILNSTDRQNSTT